MRRFRSDEKAFTRERKLTFAHLVLFLLNLVKGSVEDELDALFQTLHGQEPDALFATLSAFTQARKKLKFEVFIELNRLLVDTLYQQDCRRWHGFRVGAVDGSVLNLPEQPALRAHFQPEAQNRPQARASQLYDVLNQVKLDDRLEPMSMSGGGSSGADSGRRSLAVRSWVSVLLPVCPASSDRSGLLRPQPPETAQ